MQDNKIIQIGDPRLREKSELVDSELFGSNELHCLANLLVQLMQQHNGVGLAAPQIGINKKLLVLGFKKSERRPKEKPIELAVLVNPEIFPMSDLISEDYEGCLSVGNGLMAKIPRYQKIGFRAYTADGNMIEQEVSGLHARIIQHEVDHLNGIIFLDRVQDSKTFGFYNELLESGSI